MSDMLRLELALYSVGTIMLMACGAVMVIFS